MIREPVYSPQADEMIKQLETGTDARVYDAVCDAIDLICDHGDSAEARRYQLRGAGRVVWRVPARGTDMVVLWAPIDTEAYIYFIGVLRDLNSGRSDQSD